MWGRFLVIGSMMMLMTSSQALGQAAQSGRESGGKDMAGLIASAIGAAMMAPPCMATPPCQACCMMMAQALAQIPASGGASGGANNAASQMSIPGSNTPKGPNPDIYNGGLDPKLVEGINKAKDVANKKGIKIDDKSIKLDGKSYPLNGDTSSAAGLAGLGFNKNDISKALEVAGQVATAAHATVGAAGGETKGGGSASGSADASKKPSTVAIAPPPKKQEVSLAGMTKRVGDDQIGVAADDIFNMIKRRYGKEDAGAKFFEK